MKMDLKRSAVWKYFTDLRKVNSTHFVECKICNKKYSHKGNTTNMFHHLKANHSSIYSDILRQRQLSSEYNAVATITSNSNIEITSVPQPLEVKLEPTFIDTDQPNMPEYVHQDRVTEETLQSETSNETTYNNKNTFRAHNGDEILPQPSTSSITLLGDSSLNRSNKNFKLDEDLSTKITYLSSEIHYIKENMAKMAGGSDRHFFNSISSEFENMDDDSKDLIKVALWQLIYKVKCARKKNVEVDLNDLLK